MHLSCTTNIKTKFNQYHIIDKMSYNVKNVYNFCLYKLNKEYEENKKMLSQQSLYYAVKSETNLFNYLPSQIIQQTISKLYKNYKSYFSLLKKQTQQKVRPPKFLPKDGRKEIIFQKDSFRIKDGFIHLSIGKIFKKEHNIKHIKLNLPPYLQDKEIKYIEIIPKHNYYQMSITYIQKEPELKQEFNNWLSIDIGLNNLLSCASNATKAFIINGKPIKSINQKFNKKLARLKSIATKINGRKTTKRIQQLFTRRNNKINNEIHKITDFIVKVVQEHKIDKVIVGYNPTWKQEINIGKRNNQNFVQIPFLKIIEQLTYKLKLIGIELLIQEESYTSKVSALDLEELSKQETYKGKRIKRGLFRTSLGKLINADINGALNIFRKAIKTLSKVVQDELFKLHWIVGLVMNPVKVTLRTNLSIKDTLILVYSLSPQVTFTKENH